MKLIFVLLIFITSSLFAATTLETKPTDGKVEFDAVGRPSLLKIKGTGEGAVAKLNIEGGKLNGEIKFNLNTLVTGIELRDEHMKNKYLEVVQYPEAVLTFKDFLLPSAWSIKSPRIINSSFKGTLKLHGVEKELTGNFSIENNQFQSSAKFDVKLSDFKIVIPTYLGVKVADVINVTVNFNQMTAFESPAAKK